MKISIKDADKAEVLVRLYRNANMAGAQPNPLVQSMYSQLPELKYEQAQAMLRGRAFGFDYIGTKSVKVDLSGDELDAWTYDRDNGEGAARRALEGLPGIVIEPEEPKTVLFERG